MSSFTAPTGVPLIEIAIRSVNINALISLRALTTFSPEIPQTLSSHMTSRFRIRGVLVEKCDAIQLLSVCNRVRVADQNFLDSHRMH